MNLSYLQTLNVQNLAHDTMNLARHHDEMIVNEAGKFVVVNSRLQSYNFNIITPVDLLDQTAKSQLIIEIETFTEQKLPFNMWCYEHDTELIRYLEQIGLSNYKITYDAMALLLDNLTTVNSTNQSLHIKSVQSMDELLAFVAVLLTVYDEQTEKLAIKEYYERLSNVLLNQWTTTRLYIGTFQGEIVTTGALTLKKESVGMYHIATDPAYRGFGFATEMVRQLLAIAKESSAKYCTLQASPAAKGIYHSFGFETIGCLQVFENK